MNNNNVRLLLVAVASLFFASTPGVYSNKGPQRQGQATGHQTTEHEQIKKQTAEQTEQTSLYTKAKLKVKKACSFIKDKTVRAFGHTKNFVLKPKVKATLIYSGIILAATSFGVAMQRGALGEKAKEFPDLVINASRKSGTAVKNFLVSIPGYGKKSCSKVGGAFTRAFGWIRSIFSKKDGDQKDKEGNKNGNGDTNNRSSGE